MIPRESPKDRKERRRSSRRLYRLGDTMAELVPVETLQDIRIEAHHKIKRILITAPQVATLAN
jgi:hypothetical protein